MVEHRAELKQMVAIIVFCSFFLAECWFLVITVNNIFLKNVITFSNELAFFRFSKVEGQQQKIILALNVTTSKLWNRQI